MALYYAFSPATPRPHHKVTVTLAGLSATTSYTVTIRKPGGGTQTVPVTTDGSGGAVFTYTDSTTGTATFDVLTVVTPASQGTGSCRHAA
jgi:hypothetical protein